MPKKGSEKKLRAYSEFLAYQPLPVFAPQYLHGVPKQGCACVSCMAEDHSSGVSYKNCAFRPLHHYFTMTNMMRMDGMMVIMVTRTAMAMAT
jgi:hypothetical protein